MFLHEYLASLGALKEVQVTDSDRAMAAVIRQVPYMDFCEQSPKSKMGFDGFLDEQGSFLPFGFSMKTSALVELAGKVQEHYAKTVGASYGQLTMALYLALAAKHSGSPELETAMWAVEWLGRIVHEASSLGGYKPAAALYHDGLKMSVRAKAVLVVGPGLHAWYKTMKLALADACERPKGCMYLQGPMALQVCVKAALGAEITPAQAEWLIAVKKVLMAQGDIEACKETIRHAEMPLFSGTVGQFASLAGLLRRSSKGIQVSGFYEEGAFEEGSEGRIFADHVTPETIDLFLGRASVVSRMAMTALFVQQDLAAVRRQVEDERDSF